MLCRFLQAKKDPDDVEIKTLKYTLLVSVKMVVLSTLTPFSLLVEIPFPIT